MFYKKEVRDVSGDFKSGDFKKSMLLYKTKGYLEATTESDQQSEEVILYAEKLLKMIESELKNIEENN